VLVIEVRSGTGANRGNGEEVWDFAQLPAFTPITPIGVNMRSKYDAFPNVEMWEHQSTLSQRW
jgi:hypothetical protein